MTGADDDPISRLFQGEGPLLQAMLAERARELAVDPSSENPPEDRMAVLILMAQGHGWALPVEAVMRVEPLGPCQMLPGQSPAVLGLALLAGRRCLVADLAALKLSLPPRPASRPGHAVLLRDHPLALAVDRAEAIRWLPRPQPGGHVLADGSLLLEAGHLGAEFGAGGRA